VLHITRWWWWTMKTGVNGGGGVDSRTKARQWRGEDDIWHHWWWLQRWGWGGQHRCWCWRWRQGWWQRLRWGRPSYFDCRQRDNIPANIWEYIRWWRCWVAPCVVLRGRWLRQGSALQDVSLHRVSKTMTNAPMYLLTCNVHPGGDRHQAAPTALADWQSSILLCGGGTETAPHSFRWGEEEGHWQSSSSTVQCLMCNIQLPALHQAQHLAEGRHPQQGTTMTALSPLSCSSLY